MNRAAIRGLGVVDSRFPTNDDPGIQLRLTSSFFKIRLNDTDDETMLVCGGQRDIQSMWNASLLNG